MLKYQVNAIYRTIQGEGYWAGMPCTLVRFQGCNLRCPFCDTKQALDPGGGDEIELTVLLSKIQEMHREGDIILITGGEPTLQPLAPLVNMLRMYGPVHLETNGTNPVDTDAYYSWITLSPKPPSQIAMEALGRADEIKWLVGKEEDVADLNKLLQIAGRIFCDYKRVSLQPISQDPAATELAYKACLDNGWRLSLQLHKYIGVE